MDELKLREEIIKTAKNMNKSGINQGTSGNISARWKQGMIITPSSICYKEIKPKDLVFVDLEVYKNSESIPLTNQKPSSEWQMHADILLKRKNINSVLHCHSIFATAIACHQIDLPSFHYMVAVAGGEDIKCSEYATFGTKEISRNAIKALEGRYACLLGNHGQLTLGINPKKALDLAIEVETLCHIYLQSLAIGIPNLLGLEEMKKVSNKFSEISYMRNNDQAKL